MYKFLVGCYPLFLNSVRIGIEAQYLFTYPLIFFVIFKPEKVIIPSPFLILQLTSFFFPMLL